MEIISFVGRPKGGGESIWFQPLAHVLNYL